MSKINQNNITLVGFMASGKSTVGRLLAQKLNYQFVDTDQLIETQLQCSITDIFNNHGEDYFRTLEHDIIQNVLQKNNQVISTGGGLPCFNNNMNTINVHSTSFYLQLGINKILERLKEDTSRPLMNAPDKRLNIHNLLKSRSPIYNKAHHTIMAYRSPSQIVNTIIRKI